MFEKRKDQTLEKDHYIGVGLAIGMPICMPLGVALFVITGNPGLMGAVVGFSVAVSLAIGENLAQRNARHQN